MNRMWVRTSLVIVTVMILMGLSPVIFPRFDGPPKVVDDGQVRIPDQELTEDQLAEREAFMEQGRQQAQRRTMIGLSIGAAVGLVVGILLSRSLTAPLSRLEVGAREIATQHYDHRIPEKGTQEIKIVAKAFNQMAADLEQAETLRRNMLADITHELRHPVHVLQGNLRAILDDVYPLSMDEIENLLVQAELLTTLTNDLYELAQAEAHQLPIHTQPANLTTLVEQVFNSYQPQADRKSVEFIFRNPQVDFWVEIDADRIWQVLGNLLNNALKYTHADGTVTVSFEDDPGHVSVHIEDTGDGIAPEHLPFIFDRFYRIDPSRDRANAGTGLGLAIASAIVELHHGSIEAHSGGPGQGSLFVVRLPLIA